MHLPTPAIFAHRGASHVAPENTLAAFRLAMEQRADGIELDVHLTADHEIVVIHDADLDRTTNGQGKIQDHRLADLKKLDAGDGEPIPTLEEVFSLVGDRMLLNIELKSFSKTANALPGRVLDLIQAHSLLENVILSSFAPRLLFRAKRICPQVRIGLLYTAGINGQLIKSLFTPALDPFSLHPQFSSVNARLLQQAQKKNRNILAWTVDQPEDIRSLFEMGIAGVITNEPKTAYQVRDGLR